MRCLLFLCFCAAAALGCDTAQKELPYYSTADFAPQWLSAPADTFHRIPAFSLTDHSGKPFTEKNLDGKLSVASFFFTSCPGICPRMAVLMDTVQQAFRHDDAVLLLSHSVTPERDSVPELRRFAAAHGVQYPRWRLLTGDRQTIYHLGRRAYFVEEDLGLTRDTSDFLHTENFVLIDRQRRIRGIYNGLNLESVRNLIQDIHTLKKERN